MAEGTSGERLLTPRALAVTRHLLSHGPATRADLGEVLQLSDASMSRVARTLLEQGVVTEETERSPQTVGRPRQILTAVPDSRHVVGVKLTEETAYGVLCDLAGTVIARARLPLPLKTDGLVPVLGTVRVIGRLMRRLGRKAPRVDGLGISVGGVVTGRSVVQEGPFLGWRDVDLGAQVSEFCRVSAVVTNDVVGLAREQLWFGAGRTHSTFGVITVGAGLGFALVREGNVVEQLIDNGHLLAHAPVDPRGPRCRLGHRGCVSSYLDREDVAARLGRAGSEVTFEELAALDPAWFAGAARALGHLIATVAGGLQTERIVLAGEDVGILHASPVTGQTLKDRLRMDEAGAPRAVLEITTGPPGFTDWARGAAVTGIQAILGAV